MPKPQGFDLRLSAPIPRSWNIETKRLAMTSDRQRFAAFDGTRQVRAELTQANLFGFRSAYSVYARTNPVTPGPGQESSELASKRRTGSKSGSIPYNCLKQTGKNEARQDRRFG
ncbi:MAG: hypothetical protein NTV52_33380 [Acidobacteria bacterium]|nr:hypothetical protein [Acidobacteriota bacterium]